MSHWIMTARLQHAMRDLYQIQENVSPRLQLLSEQLDLCGAIVESSELENIRRYIERMLYDACIQIQRHYLTVAPLYYGAPAPRTTPMVTATDEGVYTS